MNPPEYGENFVTLQMHKKDLETLIEFLNATTQTYQNIVDQAKQLNDDKSIDTFSVRMRLCSMFAEVLGEQTMIEEPKSRESH